MNSKRKIVSIVAFLFTSGLMLMQLSCSQNDYTSPLPGLIDIRLHTVTDESQLSFSPLNNFVLKVVEVRAIRSDHAYATIFADSKAIGRTTGIYNTLDVRAKDSSMIIGDGYLPPGDYISIFMIVEPGEFIVLDGYRSIKVNRVEGFSNSLNFEQAFHVTEQRTTKIVLTIDLIRSLRKEPDSYRYKPLYYISSIRYE